MNIFNKIIQIFSANKVSQGSYMDIEEHFILDMSKDLDNYGVIKEFDSFIFLPDYDEKASLVLLLSKTGISPVKINEVISIKDRISMFSNALKEVEKYYDSRYDEYLPCFSEERKICYRFLIKFIANHIRIEEAIESTFLYLLLMIGEILHWTLIQKRIYARNWEHLSNILSLEPRDYEWGILKFFDKRLLYSFAYIISSKNVSIDDVMNTGFNFLKMNIGRGITAHGSLYLALGEESVVNIICRIIQVLIDTKKYRFDDWLVKSVSFDSQIIKPKNYRFNISKMQHHPKYINSFILDSNDYPFIKQDLDTIKRIIDRTTENYSLPKLPLSISSIDFNNLCTKLDYNPFTKTGKKSAYPYKLHLFGKRRIYDNRSEAGYTLIIYYGENQNVRKFKYCNSINSNFYVLEGKLNNNTLSVSKILVNNAPI